MEEGAVLLGRILAVLLLAGAGVLALALAVRLRGRLWWVASRVAVLSVAFVWFWFAPKRATAWGRAAVSGVRPSQGGRWGDPGADSGQRTPLKVRLKALSAQKIATGKYADTDWLCYGLLARGVITLLAADPKCGKTELLFGLIRAAFARLDFCGLATKPMRVLILSEQAPSTLAPFVRRWGFFVQPSGWWDALRQEHLPPKGSPGHVVRVVSWGQLYGGKTGAERPTWADVAPAGIALAVRGGYDVLCVDTLGRWAVGEDGSINSGATMLRAMGSLHEAADKGLCVAVNHHNSRSGNVMGSFSIEGEVDIILKLGKDPAAGEDADLTPRRLLKGSGRYQETPAALAVQLVRVGDAPPGQPTARYEATAPARRALPPPTQAKPLLSKDQPKEKPLAPQQQAVLAALQARRLLGGTVADLCRETALDRRRVDDALKALASRSEAFQKGTVPLPGGGKAARWVATAALLTMRADPQDTVSGEDAPPHHRGVQGGAA